MAGYRQMVWAIDPKGRQDFRIHSPFTLRATSSIDALEQLVEPYPVRLCLYSTDSVAQVIPQSQACRR